MAIQKVNAITVEKLLAENLRIPSYQRPYSWTPELALQLLDDLHEAMKDPHPDITPYVLGAVILFKNETDSCLEVVDGQQRLLTLTMMLRLLKVNGVHYPKNVYEADNPIGRVLSVLRNRIGLFSQDEREALVSFTLHRCELIRIETDDVDEAFRVFDSQNYRGKPLAPHDLLKAFHLREMRDESAETKAMVVEAWESVKDEDLDRLFSTYLYRIARWSRGESATQFGLHDIAMFKGITLKRNRSPSARYHLAAQAALPMLSAWDDVGTRLTARELGRSRFQLDAPLRAGRSFFEMVGFMLSELKQLANEGFSGDYRKFSVYSDQHGGRDGLSLLPSRSRYRYASELYLAALFYYTNKFGEEDLDVARDRLFAWAYAARVELQRVQFRSIDKRAREHSEQHGLSAFCLLRTAETGRVLRQLSAPTKTASSADEPDLLKLIRNGMRNEP